MKYEAERASLDLHDDFKGIKPLWPNVNLTLWSIINMLYRSNEYIYLENKELLIHAFSNSPANMRRSTIAGLLLAHRLRCCANNKPALHHRLEVDRNSPTPQCCMHAHGKPKENVTHIYQVVIMIYIVLR